MAVTVKQVEALPEAWPNAVPAMPIFGEDWNGNVYGGDALAWASAAPAHDHAGGSAVGRG